MLSPEQWKRFQAHYTESEDDECWIWHGARNLKGYGRVRLQKILYGAHRIAWSYANNQEIPEGMVIMHNCDNPPCVNPAHLSLGTHLDNNNDKIEKGRIYSPDYCPQGHVYITMIFQGKPYKKCRACNRESAKLSRERKKSGNH